MRSTPNERIYRYELQDTAREIYRRFGVVWNVKGLYSCCRYAPKNEIRFDVTGDGSVCLIGLNHCNSRSSCPVCAYPMQLGTLNDLENAIWLARHKGYGVYLVTYTFSHGVGDNLAMIQDMFSEAKQMMYRDKSFRGVMDYYGYIGRITDYEIQLCGRNGYHPHTHDLSVMDADLDLDEVRDIYADYWCRFLDAVGLSARDDISVTVLGYKGVGDYITKMGCEVSLGNFTKQSRGEGSLSPFQCLAMYKETGKEFYAVNWLEYVLNIKRKRIIGWSRGLKDRLGLAEFKEENEACEEFGSCPLLVLDDVKEVDVLRPWQWRTLKECLEKGMIEEVEEVLKKVRISYHVNKIGLQRYEEVLK